MKIPLPRTKGRQLNRSCVPGFVTPLTYNLLTRKGICPFCYQEKDVMEVTNEGKVRFKKHSSPRHP